MSVNKLLAVCLLALLANGSTLNYLGSQPSGNIGGSPFKVQAVLKKIDVAQGVVAFRAGDKDRSAKTTKDFKVLDATGKELTAGLKAKELQPGVQVTLIIQAQGGKPALLTIQLGKQGAAPPQEKTDPKGKVETNFDTSKMKPLTDLGADKYQGFPGGLYPNGKNERPATHEAAGLALAKQIRPLDADGKPNPDGKIVLLGIGFSNTFQAFKGFLEVAKEDKDLNPRLVLVNGAVGGVPAFQAQKEDGKGSKGIVYWEEVNKRLKDAGVTAQQIQVIWLKETNPGPHKGNFPAYIKELQEQMEKIVQLSLRRFPNLKMIYLSSRTWAGWARVPPSRPMQKAPGNAEPYSYETGFAVQWLIAKQLQGDAALNYDPKKGMVKAPWLCWGPYLWANGTQKRKDGFHFELSDFRDDDRMHHSAQGMRKMGTQVLQFFKTDATTKGWFVKELKK